MGQQVADLPALDGAEERLSAAVDAFNAAMIAAHEAGFKVNAALFMRNRDHCSVAQISFAIQNRQPLSANADGS